MLQKVLNKLVNMLYFVITKKKFEEINNNMSGNSKNLNELYDTLNNNIKGYNKRLNNIEINIKSLNDKKLFVKIIIMI